MKVLAFRGLLLLCVVVSGFADKIDFWDIQRRGGNNFNGEPTKESWFKHASQTGLEWVRLSWGKRRNFLVGSTSDYKGLVAKDLQELKQAVAYAAKYNVKIVLVPISLPGAQFRQLRNGKGNDMRLWTDKKYWKMTAKMWQDIASEFKDNPTVVAYNIFNEPYPEFGTDVAEQGSIENASRYYEWIKKYKGTARDLEEFYRTVIVSIRAVDTQTPITVESGWYGQPNTFVHWTPFKDDKILYQFHMYEPYNFTSGLNFRKKLKLQYPGKIPFGDGDDGKLVLWNRETMELYFKPFYGWAAKNMSQVIA